MRVRHVAIYVTDLRESEEHYVALFGLRVLFRETRRPDGTWQALPRTQGFEDAERSDRPVGMVALRRDDFVLALFSSAMPGKQVHALGLLMEEGEIDAVAAHLPAGTHVEERARGWLSLVDRYGIRWQLAARAEFMPTRPAPEQRPGDRPENE